jgi:hypothetical protein
MDLSEMIDSAFRDALYERGLVIRDEIATNPYIIRVGKAAVATGYTYQGTGADRTEALRSIIEQLDHEPVG